MYSAVVEVRHASLPLVIVGFLVAWLNFLWSAYGYMLLAPKIKLRNILLVHIAASGAGRVIPGGGGHFSFGVLFLKKQRYSTEAALAIATINNGMGFLVNSLYFLPILLFKYKELPSINLLTPQRLVFVIVAVICSIGVFWLYKNNKNVKKSTNKTTKELRNKLAQLGLQPARLLALFLTMSAQIATHVAVLIIASYALDTPITLVHGFIAMSSGVAIGSLLPTPGGIGGVEAGIIASLNTLGTPIDTATSVTLLYRAATYLQPLVPGILSYLYLRKNKLL